MGLGKAPGVWRWEQRGEQWWRIHDKLNIEDGPYDAGRKAIMERELVTEIIGEGAQKGWTDTALADAIRALTGESVSPPSRMYHVTFVADVEADTKTTAIEEARQLILDERYEPRSVVEE